MLRIKDQVKASFGLNVSHSVVHDINSMLFYVLFKYFGSDDISIFDNSLPLANQ